MSQPLGNTALVALHREIYQRQRAEIDASVEGYSGGFRAYEKAYRQRVTGYRGILEYDEVVARAAARDVVHVGDYHTLTHAQRAFGKLVQRVLGHGRPVALGLEFVAGRHQRHVDSFLLGRLTERNFLKRIDYPEHHVFRIWPGFAPLFLLARELGLPVVALDLENASLVKRDEYAAGRLARFRQKHPQHQLMVLTGQLHVAPSHLPRALARACRRLGQDAPSQLSVYQNAEEIYWKLTARGLEHQAQAVEVSKEEICLVNTSPIVAQQSYLAHLHDDVGVDDGLESAPERTFKSMCRYLADFLEVELGDALDHVLVYTLGDLSFLSELERKKQFNRREVAYIRRRILERESCFLPRAGVVYLASLSVNHAAEEAAHFLRHVLTEDDGDRDGLVDAFYSRILNEAIAFFGSKVINPRRKCAHPPRLKALVDDWQRGDRKGLRHGDVRAAEVTLAHLRLEAGERVPGLRKIYAEADADLFNAVTHLLGYILGDRLYHAMVQGKVTKEQMRALFLDPLEEAGDTFHAYFHLSSRVRRVRIPQQP
ncbi:MAG: ChaN family lipoprotein [Deltaproteobacteria bacterium]|nr:ChaN family lipoprotein [Deltaproteobacteria bacterium]